MFKKIILPVIILLIAYFYYKNQGKEGKLVETKSGLVKGIISTSRNGREFYEWLKIPYAQPPIGPLRFSTPKPVEKWQGILDTSRYGPYCAQTELFTTFISGQEDCLHLNIHVPKLDSKGQSTKLLPVMFYIHGGAFVSLSAIDLKANYFMDEDVVLITTNYRLGPLGFLSTGDKSIRGNMGLKDQLLALQWVKSNIKAFGGDPERITIFGESAGAVSVHILTLTEKTRGLYQKAIALSGSALTTWGFTPPEKAKDKAISFAKELNCPTDNTQELADCLRNANLRDILQTFKKDVQNFPLINPAKNGDMISPTVEAIEDDEALLTQFPFDLLVQGKAQRVPLLAGVLKDEGLLASLEFKRDDDAQSYFENNWDDCVEVSLSLSKLSKEKRKEFAKELWKFYLTQDGQKIELSTEEKFKRLTDMFSDGLFIVGTSEMATIQRKYSSVYLYYYNKSGGLTIANMLGEIKTRYHFVVEGLIYGVQFLYDYLLGLPFKDYGVCHADDVQMMFPMLKYILEIPKNEQNLNYKFSRDFVKFLVSFATDEKSMEFRAAKLPQTPKDGPLKYLELSDDENPKIINEPFSKRMSFWHSLNYTQLFAV